MRCDAERACWAPTGPCRAGGHAFIGGLTGGASGAVGGAASSLIAPHLYEALVTSGLPPVTAQALTMLGTGSVGAAFGGSPAALAAVTETGNNWVNFLTNITRLAGQAATSGVNSLNAGGLAALRQCAGLDWCSVLMTTSVIAAVTAPQIAINPPSLADQIPGGYGAGVQPQPGGPLVNVPVMPGSATGTTSPITALPGLGNTTTTIAQPVTTGTSGFGAGPAPAVSTVVLNVNGAPTSVQLPSIIDSDKAVHILTGDGPGKGGHQWPGQAGKSPFPQSWSADDILGYVSDVATDPNSIVTSAGGGRTAVTGIRNGIEIRVIIERPNHPLHPGRVVTAYPINVPRNP